MTLSPGTRVGHYKVVGPLGSGGMGEVYRATDTRLGRDVALKVLPAEMASHPERLERFRREAQALAALDHPGIVTVFSVEEADGVHFLTMQLVEGVSLDQVIPEVGLPGETLRAMAVALADALEAAHTKGIVHRDLKPANVMVTGEGRIKVLDFGLAKLTGSLHDDPAASGLPTHAHTRDGVVLGTVPYMSPEQVHGRTVDHRSDIYALGVILYEMATGRRPFQADSTAGLMSAILRDTPAPVASSRADLGPELLHVIERCLQKHAADRPQTAREVGALLRGVATAESQVTALGAAPREGSRGIAVVVLPFVNRSPDPGNEYFSDGLTEEIITDLSRVETLRVISRNSAMALKGATAGTPVIAKQLGVTHVVSGSVRRAGDALRVTAELIDAASDAPVWSDKYSGTVADVFGIQEEIARKIVTALKLKLTDSGEQEIAARPIDNVVAHDCYLRARQEIYGWTPESLGRATRLVDEALGIVGENPLLLVTKGQIAWTIVNAMFDPDERHLDEADACARRALGIEPQHAPGLFLRGIVAGLRGRSADALRDIHRAFELRPADPNILAELIRFANAAGVEIEDHVSQVVAIDPLTPVTWACVSFNHFVCGRLQEAVPAARRQVELVRDASMFHIFSGWVCAMAGLRDEAMELLDVAGRGLTGSVLGSWARFLTCALEGDADRARSEVTPLLERGASLQDHATHVMAGAYSLLGQNDDALRWIRIGMERGLINYPFLAARNPTLQGVRSDPRFPALMREVRERWEALGSALPSPLRLVAWRDDAR